MVCCAKNASVHVVACPTLSNIREDRVMSFMSRIAEIACVATTRAYRCDDLIGGRCHGAHVTEIGRPSGLGHEHRSCDGHDDPIVSGGLQPISLHRSGPGAH